MNQRSKACSALSVIGMLVMLATAAGAQSSENEAAASSRLKAQQEKKAKQLSGTWALTITVTSGFPQLPPPFPGLITFTQDGGLLLTFVPFPGLIQYPAQGEWVRTGNREFAFSASGFHFDEKGNFLAVFKLRGTVTVNEALDEVTSRVKWEFTLPTGQVAVSGEGTMSGRRTGVEPVE